MDFDSAIPLSQMLSSTLSIARDARDLAGQSTDNELKGVVGQLFDAFSAMKERMLAMDDEITKLKARLTKMADVSGPVAPFGYFYKNGDAEHPLCPKCYQEKGREYMLTTDHFNGGTSRACQCGWSIEEVPAQAVGQVRLGRMSRRR
jgi:hypothetical protein